jgi:hypothetical protein
MKTKVELQPNVKAFLIKNRVYKRFVTNVTTLNNDGGVQASFKLMIL